MHDELLRRRPLTLKGARLPWPRLLALRRETLAVIEGRDLLLVLGGADKDELRTRHVSVLGWAPARLHVAPSGKYVLLESSRGNYVQVLEADSGKRVAELVAPEAVSFALTRTGDDDLVVCSRTPGVLEGLSLPKLEVAFRVDCARPVPFVFDRLEALVDLDELAVVGHPWLEPLDTVHLVHVSDLLADPETAAQRFRAPPLLLGETCFAGLGHGDDVPVLSQSDDPGTPDRLDLVSFDGGAARPLATVPRVEEASPALMLGARALVLGRGGALHAFARSDVTAAPLVFPSRVRGVDRAGGRLVQWPGDGPLELVEIVE